MANRRANELTLFGIVVAFAAAPITGGASLLGLPAVLAARGVRAKLDELERNSREKEEDSDMYYRSDLNYPIVSGLPSVSYPIIPDSRSVLAKTNPDKAAKVFLRDNDSELMKKAIDSLSPSVLEMVRNRPGCSHIGVRMRAGRRGLFGWGDFYCDIDIDID